MPVDDTKLLILQALNSVVQKESLDKISIGDVAEEAKISRQTFYYHFNSILDVVKWALQNDRKYTNLNILSPSQTLDRMYDWACAIERNRELIKAVLFSRSGPELEIALYEENMRIAIPIALSLMPDKSEDVLNIGASFLASAYTGMVYRWVINDNPTTMLDLHLSLCKSMRNILKPTLYDTTIGHWAEEHASLRAPDPDPLRPLGIY